MGKNCARGLEYGPRPSASGHTQDKGTVFSHTDRPSSVNNIYFFFCISSFNVGKQIYRHHLVQSLFLRIVKIRFHCVRSLQNTFF